MRMGTTAMTGKLKPADDALGLRPEAGQAISPIDVLPALNVRGFLVPVGCLDRRSCGYRRGPAGDGSSRRAALSLHGPAGHDARH
jgi:hypothetical protein